jgi:hypothetical protein
MAIELVPLATATITLAEPFMLPGTPTGTRVIAEVADAVLEGDRLSGRLRGNAAADWMTLSAAMVATLDVRALFETHDGALVYTWYQGRMDLSNGPEGASIYAAPLYETGDERYAWLNLVQGVAKGRLTEGATKLVYEICEIR